MGFDPSQGLIGKAVSSSEWASARRGMLIAANVEDTRRTAETGDYRARVRHNLAFHGLLANAEKNPVCRYVPTCAMHNCRPAPYQPDIKVAKPEKQVEK
jgi:hypothetical protein